MITHTYQGACDSHVKHVNSMSQDQTRHLAHALALSILTNSSILFDTMKDHWRFGPYTPIFLIPRTLLMGF